MVISIIQTSSSTIINATICIDKYWF